MLGYSDQTDIQNRIGNTIIKQNVGCEQIIHNLRIERTTNTSTTNYQNLQIELEPSTSHCVKTKNKHSATGTRTRVAQVRAEYPNQLDYSGF